MNSPDEFYLRLSTQLSSPQIIPSKYRASVAILLRDPTGDNTEPFLPEVLFIQRAANQTDRWSAHIAFPGGRRDPTDSSDYDTALRETFEEVGLRLNDDKLYKYVGRLDDRPINHKGTYIMSAFIFRQLPPKLDPREKNKLESRQESLVIHPSQLQSNEVNCVFWTSLRYLHYKSPAVTYHLYTQSRLTEINSLMDRLKFTCIEFIGFSVLRMPAADILNETIALDRVNADKQRLEAPHVFLWGLTLAAVGDVLEATGAGYRRIDRPKALPQSKLLGGIIWLLVEIWCFIQNILSR